MNSANIISKLVIYADLIRFNKPIGSYLLLWPTLWALAIAGEGQPDAWITFVFVTGVFLMRSAGCAINDYADRDFDKHVIRTVDRPITSGKIEAYEALIVFAVLSLIAFMLVLTLNEFTIWLSLGGVLLAGSYPFMKRYHFLPQVHLGAAFSWAIPMAFAAQTGEITKIVWLIYFANLLWTTAYDTIYGMVDIEDDLKIGIKSTAILFGDYNRQMVALLQTLFMIGMIIVGLELEFDRYYYLALGAASAHFVYQHVLIFKQIPDKCFDAFLSNHWLGAIIFFGIISQYIKF